mmetsp:Transcript_9758/g.28632  ORF Transcript_9758/g.28632 Transcript_9758/m.28632 type:complete len:413 (+) Transcript_9758:304-1542(+)
MIQVDTVFLVRLDHRLHLLQGFLHCRLRLRIGFLDPGGERRDHDAYRFGVPRGVLLRVGANVFPELGHLVGEHCALRPLESDSRVDGLLHASRSLHLHGSPGVDGLGSRDEGLARLRCRLEMLQRFVLAIHRLVGGDAGSHAAVSHHRLPSGSTAPGTEEGGNDRMVGILEAQSIVQRGVSEGVLRVHVDPRNPKQEDYCRLLQRACSHVQGRAAERVARVHVALVLDEARQLASVLRGGSHAQVLRLVECAPKARAVLDEGVSAQLVAAGDCQPKRSEAVLILNVDVCLLVDEVLEHGQLPLGRRDVQRDPAMGVGGVHRVFLLHELLQLPLVAIGNGLAEVVVRMTVAELCQAAPLLGACLLEDSDDFLVALEEGIRERRPASLVFRVDVGPRRYEEFGYLRAAATGTKV